MSPPEISRRCLSCGAAVRAGSRFCPQCGNALEAGAAPGASDESRVEVPRTFAPPTDERAPQELSAPPTKEFTAFEQSPVVPAAPVEPEASADAEVEEGRAGDLRERVARVREGTKARVGRMREEAIVVLEETPDDSGLRFVLAAVALFVIFVFLLFLSTTIFR